MKASTLPLAGVLVLALGALAAAGASKAVGPTAHVHVAASELKWGEGLPSLPPGSKVAILSGDPKLEGPFVMRLKLPDGYRIAPHSHPAHEHLTVISGTFQLGMADKFDAAKLKPLKAGDFAMMPPGHIHFAAAQGETVVQVHGWGPWSIIYVNPADDPRTRNKAR